jgi:hypothetical protein
MTLKSKRWTVLSKKGCKTTITEASSVPKFATPRSALVSVETVNRTIMRMQMLIYSFAEWTPG